MKDVLLKERHALSKRHEELTAEGAPLRAQLGNIDRQRALLRERIAVLEKQMATPDAEPRISDHAVVRYLEDVFVSLTGETVE